MANTTRTSRVRCACGNMTVAEANAGKTVIPPDSARSIIVVGGWLRSAGATTNCTTVDVCSDATIPIVNVAVAAAQLGNGVIAPLSGTATWTTFGVANAKGDGIQILTVGTDESTATAYDYCIEYMTV